MISAVLCPTSCGVQLLRGEHYYKTPETYFKDLVQQPWMDSTYTQFMYTHSEALYDIGDKIAGYIHKHNLGFVMKSRAGNNPVHGRNITVWVWTRDNIGFMKHREELLAPKKEELCPKSTKPVTAASTKSQASETLNGMIPVQLESSC